MVTPKVCAVQEAPPSIMSGQEGELDELSQAQMDDSELRQIIDCKKQADGPIPETLELQKYAPVWNQLQVQGPDGENSSCPF